MPKLISIKEVELKFKKGRTIKERDVPDDPSVVFELFKDLQNERKEKFITIFLDAKHKILCFEVIAIGVINTIHLRPIEAFSTGIPLHATSAVVVHNHPSGDTTPSAADKDITKALFQISHIISLHFLDHIIIGEEGYFSFEENDMMHFETLKEEGLRVGMSKGRREGLEKGLEKGEANGLARGEAIGVEKGRQEGEAKLKKAVERMLSKGQTVDFISAVLDLEAEEVQRIADRLK